MATRNDEAPTVAAVRASNDSTPTKGTEIMKKGTTGPGCTSCALSTGVPVNTGTAKAQVTCAQTISAMSDCAQALLGRLERLSRTRDATVAERVWLQCDWLANAAQRLRLDLQAEALP